MNTKKTKKKEPDFVKEILDDIKETEVNQKEKSQGLQGNLEKPQQLSIRASKEDIEFFNEFKKEYPTALDAFSALVKLATRKDVELNSNETIVELTAELTSFIDPSQDENLNDTFSRLKRLLDEKPKEVIKETETEKELLPNQAIITFEEKTGTNIRKVRPFIAKGNYLKYDKTNPQDFLNSLVNHSVNRILRIDFDNIVNPL